jgi:hypothetical protein
MLFALLLYYRCYRTTFLEKPILAVEVFGTSEFWVICSWRDCDWVCWLLSCGGWFRARTAVSSSSASLEFRGNSHWYRILRNLCWQRLSLMLWPWSLADLFVGNWVVSSSWGWPGLGGTNLACLQSTTWQSCHRYRLWVLRCSHCTFCALSYWPPKRCCPELKRSESSSSGWRRGCLLVQDSADGWWSRGPRKYTSCCPDRWVTLSPETFSRSLTCGTRSIAFWLVWRLSKLSSK